MNKSAAITALAISALALASCSTEAANENSADNEPTNQTTAQTPSEAPESEAAGESTAESAEATAERTAQAAPAASGLFDEAALKSELEGLGYQCDGDDDCTKTDGAFIYDIDIDDDSVDAEVQGNGDLNPHFETILSDVGTAFGDYDFGGSTWDKIQTWALGAGDDQETVIGNVELDHDLGEDDGVPNRELSIDLLNS